MPTELELGVAVAIEDSSQVGEARRTATTVARASGLSETDAGKFALIATEAATNIAKHATRGEIIMRSVNTRGASGVDLIAIDTGPGIADLDRALRDGYSTAGSSGHGLGAMSRLATAFEIFSTVGSGTVLSARIEANQPGSRPSRRFDVGIVRVPKRGETECGDACGIIVDEIGRTTVAVADGLGHGAFAAVASRRAVEIAIERAAESPGMILTAVHAGLRPTRGAAVAIAELSADQASVQFAGLGNISATIVGPGGSKSLLSHNGIAGHEMRKIQEFPYAWPANALLVLHSDGLTTRWDLSAYPGLVQRHPSVVAGVLYRDFSRGRDDSLVVVIRPVA